MTEGYSLPRSPEGRASLVPAPPWHYAGDMLVIEYWAEPDAVAAVLPPGLEPYADDPGRAAALFVEWQSCTDSREELLDPARSQYKEFFIVVNALRDVVAAYRLIAQARVSRISSAESLRSFMVENQLRPLTPERLALEFNRQEALAQAERVEVAALAAYASSIANLFAATGTALEHNRVEFKVEE